MPDRDQIEQRVAELRSFAAYAMVPEVRERYRAEAERLARLLIDALDERERAADA